MQQILWEDTIDKESESGTFCKELMKAIMGMLFLPGLTVSKTAYEAHLEQTRHCGMTNGETYASLLWYACKFKNFVNVLVGVLV